MSPSKAPIQQTSATNLPTKANSATAANQGLGPMPLPRSRSVQVNPATGERVPVDETSVMESSGSVVPPDSVNVANMQGIVPPREMRHPQTREALKSRDRTLEMAAAAHNGKLPTNAQATAALDRLTETGAFTNVSQGLSPAGQKLVRDAEALVRTTRANLAAKNDGDYLQESMYSSHQAASEARQSGNAKGFRSAARRERGNVDLSMGKDAVNRFTTVAKLMASSNEFRQLVREFYSISRDTLTSNLPTDEEGRAKAQDTMDDATNRAASNDTASAYGVNRSGTNGSGMNASGMNTSGMNTSGMNTSDVSSSGIDASGVDRYGINESGIDASGINASSSGMIPTDQYPDDAQPRQTSGKKGKGKKAAKGGSVLPSSAHENIPGAQQSYHQAAKDPSAIRGNDPNVTNEDTHQQMRDIAHPIVDTVISTTAPHVADVRRGDASVGDKARHALKSSTQALNRNVRNVKLTQEQKDRLYERVKRLLQSMQDNPDYQTAITSLVDLFSHLSTRTTKAAQRVSTHARQTHGQSSTQEAENNARNLLENFAGGRSLQPVIDALAELRAVLRDDAEARQWLKEVKSMIKSSAREPAVLDQQQHREHANQLMDTGRELFGDRYQPHANELSSQVSHFLQGFTEDSLNQAFARDAKTLIRDVFMDEQGKPTLKPELVQDVATLMVRLASRLKYIPVPRMEILDKETDLVLDDLVLYADDIIPDQLQFRTATAVDVHHPGGKRNMNMSSSDAANQAGATTSTAVRVIIDRIKVETKDAAFYVNHKTTPKIANRGLLDFDMDQGRGVRIDMILSMATKASNAKRYIKLDRVNVDISGLKLKFHGTGHDVLYKIFSPVINSVATKQIKKALEDVIKEQLTPKSERPSKATGSSFRLSGMSLEDAENRPRAPGSVGIGAGPGEPAWSSHAYDLQ